MNMGPLPHGNGMASVCSDRGSVANQFAPSLVERTNRPTDRPIEKTNQSSFHGGLVASKRMNVMLKNERGVNYLCLCFAFWRGHYNDYTWWDNQGPGDN